MGGVLLRADDADVMSSGVRVLRSLGDTAEAEWKGRVGSGGCHSVSETDQSSFIYRAENKLTIPEGFAVGWKWTLIAADLQRSQGSFIQGKYQPDRPDLFPCYRLPVIIAGRWCMCNVAMFVRVCVMEGKLCRKRFV